VSEASSIIARRRIGAVVVSDESGALCGILTERDVVRGLTEHGGALLNLKVEALMARDVQVVTGATSVDEAMEIMNGGRFRHLPVVKAGRLCGIVSLGDLVSYGIRRTALQSPQRHLRGPGYEFGSA